MKHLLQFILVFSLTPLASAAVKYDFSPQSGKVAFKTKGWPSLITIKGEGEGVTGQLMEDSGKISGDLVFNLGTLKTGIRNDRPACSSAPSEPDHQIP